MTLLDPAGHMPQQPIANIDGETIGVMGFAVLVLAIGAIDADVLQNWNHGRVADWQSSRNLEEMWAIHAANVAGRVASELISATSNNGEQEDIESNTGNAQSKGLERDLENNETGQPLGTPRNLPSPDASGGEIQEALGPDWSPPINPKAGWWNETTGESLYPDTTAHEDDPHWDYKYRGSRNANGNSKGWRIRPDGSVEAKE